jgi:hypothetical protein
MNSIWRIRWQLSGFAQIPAHHWLSVLIAKNQFPKPVAGPSLAASGVLNVKLYLKTGDHCNGMAQP